MLAALRRRADASVLRWQARFDGERADRFVPWASAAGLFALLVVLALAQDRSLEAPPDLAAYTQGAWLIDQGLDPVITVTTNLDVLAQQASFIFYPIAWLTQTLPTAPALLVIQSAALSLGTVPLWRLARHHANLRTGAAAALLFAYAFFPTLHNLNLAGFHPETLALPLLLAAMLWGLAGRWRLFTLACVLVVMTRADLGLAVAGIGAVLVMRKHPRRGGLTIALGVGWTLASVAWIQPFFAGDAFPHLDSFAAFGDTPGSALWSMLTHPGEVLGRLVSEQNFQLAVTLLAPVIFLPVLAPRYLVPVLPLQFLYMVAEVPTEAVFGQQTVAITAFIFLSSTFALAKIGELGVEKVRVDRRILFAIMLATSVFFIRDAAASPYRHPWDWGGRDVVDHARVEAAELIGPEASVRASASLLRPLAERPKVFQMEIGEIPDAASAADGVDVVILDTRDTADWTEVELQVFRLQLDSLGFSRLSEQEGIEVFARTGVTGSD